MKTTIIESLLVERNKEKSIPDHCIRFTLSNGTEIIVTNLGDRIKVCGNPGSLTIKPVISNCVHIFE